MNGTTSTLDFGELELGWDLRCEAGGDRFEERSRMTWVVDAGTRLSWMVMSFESEREEGTGSVWEARSTEYCRSQRRRTISCPGVCVIAERRTWEEPSERREISLVEVGDGEIKERPVREKISLMGDNVIESPSEDSSWKTCHDPSRSVKVVSQQLLK